jgi:hypothetical protein
MARETFFSRTVATEIGDKTIHASILFDDTRFGIDPAGVSPWTIAVSDGDKDLGRLVGFEGDGQVIIAMHGLKPDKMAKRGVEMTVFRVNDDLRTLGLDVQVYSAFERWLLKRGWKGDVLKKLKFTDAALVVPIREFWVKRLGFELILAEDDKWDEHVVKRWR